MMEAHLPYYSATIDVLLCVLQYANACCVYAVVVVVVVAVFRQPIHRGIHQGASQG